MLKRFLGAVGIIDLIKKGLRGNEPLFEGAITGYVTIDDLIKKGLRLYIGVGMEDIFGA